MPTRRIAAIVPCHNEAISIGKVVADLREALPTAVVYVYDNLSSDGTAEVALAAGAVVRREDNKGKGNVLRRAFADIDADVYVLIDGDDTYDAFAAPQMIETLISGPYDHVLGVRKEEAESTTAYRPGHSLGNSAFNFIVSFLFRQRVNDMLSGYRVFSRRFVKSFPALSREFEIETELTVHSLSLRIPQTEFEVGFRDRAEGSESKLNTTRDGARILGVVINLLRHERPILYHGVISVVLAIVALVIGIPVIVDFYQTGLVSRFPTAFLAASLIVLSVTILFFGLVLEANKRLRHETARLHYLALSPVNGDSE
ncbi:glycosyltransferase family 2 protein [soil metagenome]